MRPSEQLVDVDLSVLAVDVLVLFGAGTLLVALLSGRRRRGGLVLGTLLLRLCRGLSALVGCGGGRGWRRGRNGLGGLRRWLRLGGRGRTGFGRCRRCLRRQDRGARVEAIVIDVRDH